jgi:hypothetical protein
LTYVSDLVLPVIALVLSSNLKVNNARLVNNPRLNKLLVKFATKIPTGGGLAQAVGALQNVLRDGHLVWQLLTAMTPESINTGDESESSSRLAEFLAKLASQVTSLSVLIRAIDATARGVELLLSLKQLVEAGSRPGYASWPGTLARQQAFALTGRDVGTECGQASPALSPEHSSQVPECLWDVTADLDGDQRTDRLVLWSGPQGRGAQAYLAQGGPTDLQIPSAQGLGWVGGSWGSPADPNIAPARPLQLLHLDGGRRTQVLVAVRDEPGGSTTSRALIALGSDGQLQLVGLDTAGGSEVALLAGSQEFVGCATRGGKRYFITTSVFHSEHPTRPGPGTAAYGASRFLYEVQPGPVLTPVGYQGEALSSDRTAYRYKNDCGPGTIPLAEDPHLWPSTAEDAITGLVRAAQARDQVAALTFTGGDRGTFIALNDGEHGYQPDAWAYLADTRNQQLLAAAQDQPPVPDRLQDRIAGRYARYKITTPAGNLWFAIAWNGSVPVVAGVWSDALK